MITTAYSQLYLYCTIRHADLFDPLDLVIFTSRSNNDTLYSLCFEYYNILTLESL